MRALCRGRAGGCRLLCDPAVPGLGLLAVPVPAQPHGSAPRSAPLLPAALVLRALRRRRQPDPRCVRAGRAGTWGLWGCWRSEWPQDAGAKQAEFERAGVARRCSWVWVELLIFDYFFLVISVPFLSLEVA